MKTAFPIDLVILWVNGSDPDFIAQRNSWAQKNGESVSYARYVQNDELRYLLRSVEKFLPWIRRAVLVTNGQSLPPWLRTEHPKLRILTHAEFVPADCLPTFNSCAISTSIVLWKDLAEHFLLANDDTFVWQLLPPSYFFQQNKAINRFVSYPQKDYHATSYGRQLLYIVQLVKNKYPGLFLPLEPHHNVSAYIKSACLKAWQAFPDALLQTQQARFRKENNVNMLLFAAAQAMLQKGLWRRSRCSRWFGSDGMVWELWQNYEEEIKKFRPKLVCLNDSEKCLEVNRKHLVNFLQRIFPQASSFEKV